MSPEEIKDVQLRMGAGVAMMDELMTLPETFMWTKMGWESGVRLADILRQKEVERQGLPGRWPCPARSRPAWTQRPSW